MARYFLLVLPSSRTILVPPLPFGGLEAEDFAVPWSPVVTSVDKFDAQQHPILDVRTGNAADSTGGFGMGIGNNQSVKRIDCTPLSR